LLDIVVFGRRGGLDAARYARDADWPDVAERPQQDTAEMLERLLKGSGGDSFADIRAELQEQMFDFAGVVRREDGLRKMEEILLNLRDRYDRAVVMDKGRVYNTELMEAVELRFLLDLSDTLVAAALARDESRGGHYREDHPLRDDDHWLRHSLAYRQSGGEVRLEYKDVKMGPYIPMERKY
ncbi:MAG: succinate dehydrogenase/fumarate reductase flavoprotein subunit, partial [Actinomycetota bacterium]|nr:succinate dehydrogenase/fumarate reductase flavoprotein subunit [Actinomycetota bacterium]